jgi:hypothetical protein
LYLFNLCRYVVTRVRDDDEKFIWVSIGKERVKIYQEWDPALYGYFHCVRAIRKSDEWLPYYEYLLAAEFDVSDQASVDEFIAKVKAAEYLRELPIMTDNMLRGIYEGMEWGKNFYGD